VLSLILGELKIAAYSAANGFIDVLTQAYSLRGSSIVVKF
jgi:hypothetical protein